MKKLCLLPTLLLITASALAQITNGFMVHFATDEWQLATNALASLDSFIEINKHGNVKIKLYGHTDKMAGYEYNDALSLKRTAAVKNYLVKMGFDATNIIEERGFGKRKPLNSNQGKIARSVNRRVEILVERNPIAGDTGNLSDEMPTKTLTEKIEDSATTVGQNIVLSNMNFYGGTHIILPESMPVLMELVQAMKNNTTLEIAVEGHICCQEGNGDGMDLGTKTLNLSENRAREICNYLIKKGIASTRLQYKGFGHSMPLFPYPEKTEVERVQNRRVEIKILKK